MISILLAAGYATRMLPLTSLTPKTLLKINGKAIIDFICDEIDTIPAINKIILVSNSKFYEEHLRWSINRKGNKPDCTDIIVLNDGSETEAARLGAVRDIYFAIKHERINDNILVIAGDSVFTYRLIDFYNNFMTHSCDCVVVTREDKADELRRGGVVKTNSNNEIIYFAEKPVNPISNLAACACYIFKKETIPYFETYLTGGHNTDAPGHFVAWLYKQDTVFAYTPNGDFYDIGTLEAYEQVKKIFKINRSTTSHY